MVETINKAIIKEFSIKFGNNLTKLREERNLSLTKLAEGCNTYERKIRRTEKGECGINPSTCIALAIGLDISLPELFEFEYPKNLFENFWIDSPDF